MVPEQAQQVQEGATGAAQTLAQELQGLHGSVWFASLQTTELPLGHHPSIWAWSGLATDHVCALE